MMKLDVSHEILDDPQPEDVGIINITAKIFGESVVPRYETELLAKDFIDDYQKNEWKSREDLTNFLLDAGINQEGIDEAFIDLDDLVAQLTCPTSNEYSPGCAIYVWIEYVPDDYYDDDAEIDDSEYIRFRPASKQAVKSLARKIYNKKIQKEQKKKTKIYKEISLEECSICLEGFCDGGRVVTLPCGHDFDDECIVKWLETSHVCPLCRSELPCEVLQHN